MPFSKISDVVMLDQRHLCRQTSFWLRNAKL